MSVSPPRVFISYSHDSAAHKQWVLEFATTLRNRGVDAILDQWDLKPGDDLPEFMEQNLASCDFALMVCTRRYVEKANAGEGGVGYEKMIMTSSSLKSISKNKVIPIIRETGEPSTPTFLATKLYVDFTDHTGLEFALDELLRVLLGAPLYEKPEIGSDPYLPMEQARPNRTADGIRDVMTAFANAYDESDSRFIPFSALRRNTSLRRLTLDKYLAEVLVANLLGTNGDDVFVTEEGRAYLRDHGIVDA